MFVRWLEDGEHDHLVRETDCRHPGSLVKAHTIDIHSVCIRGHRGPLVHTVVVVTLWGGD